MYKFTSNAKTKVVETKDFIIQNHRQLFFSKNSLAQTAQTAIRTLILVTYVSHPFLSFTSYPCNKSIAKLPPKYKRYSE